MARYFPGAGLVPPPSFSVVSLSVTPSLVQAGSTVTNPAFTASYNEVPSAAVLTDTEGHTDNVLSTPASFSSPHAFTKNTYGASVTFTLSATGPDGSDAKSASITWAEPVYFGTAVVPGSYTQTFIKGLSAHLQLGAAGSYSVNATAGQSTFFAARSAFGLTDLNFFVGIFGFAVSKVATVAVTNSDGVTENYDLFQSDNVGLGALVFTVV